MRPARLIAAYFLVIFLGGALLAPWVHALLASLAETLPALGKLASAPFHRYVTRCWMIAGVVGLWPLLRALGLNSPQAIGFRPHKPLFHRLFPGLVLGFGTLAIAAGIATLFGPRIPNLDHSASGWIKHLFNAALAALVVAFIEELFFRGVVFGGLRQSIDWRMALLISSAVYAILHFFERSVHDGPVVWSSGLALLPRMLRGFGDIHTLLPGFLNLLVAGSLLGLAYQRTGDLRFSFGLHAGWIFWLKSYGFLTTGTAENPVWLWGSAKLIDGWMCLPLLLASIPLVNRLRPEPETCEPKLPHG